MHLSLLELFAIQHIIWMFMLTHLRVNNSCRLAFHLLRQSESHGSILEFLASFYTKKYADLPEAFQSGEFGGPRFDKVIIGFINDEKPVLQAIGFQVVCHEVRPDEAHINVGCCLHPVGIFT